MFKKQVHEQSKNNVNLCPPRNTEETLGRAEGVLEMKTNDVYQMRGVNLNKNQ